MRTLTGTIFILALAAVMLLAIILLNLTPAVPGVG